MKNIPLLRDGINAFALEHLPAEALKRHVAVDMELKLGELTGPFLEELELLEPHGVRLGAHFRHYPLKPIGVVTWVSNSPRMPPGTRATFTPIRDNLGLLGPNLPKGSPHPTPSKSTTDSDKRDTRQCGLNRMMACFRPLPAFRRSKTRRFVR